MSSEVDICNLALSRLGDEATVSSIDPPEGSAQADHCARFYSIARNALLEMHDWSFSKYRRTLALKTTDVSGWDYVYAYPADCIKITAVLPAESRTDASTEEYEITLDTDGLRCIRTNLEDATIVYQRLVTDTNRFSFLFTDALAWLLAAYLAGTVYKGKTGAEMTQNMMNGFRLTFAQATMSDANQKHHDTEQTPSWIGAR